jgi:GNAT superfamily N-acetyltransferase
MAELITQTDRLDIYQTYVPGEDGTGDAAIRLPCWTFMAFDVSSCSYSPACTVWVTINEYWIPTKLFVEWIYVSEDSRRKGYAKETLDELIDVLGHLDMIGVTPEGEGLAKSFPPPRAPSWCVQADSCDE